MSLAWTLISRPPFARRDEAVLLGTTARARPPEQFLQTHLHVSLDLSLYLLEANLPTPRQWAKAIREQGFKFKLDTDFDIRGSAGFIPCGDEAGFELLSDAMTQQEHDELCFAEPPMDWCVTLCAQGDDDFPLALAALASLASIAGGRVVDMQTGEIFTAEEALARARARFSAKASARRGPEPLDKAIGQILLPVLAEHGFKLLKKRWYYRVRNRIAQYFYLERCRRDPNGFYARGGRALDAAPRFPVLREAGLFRAPRRTQLAAMVRC
ncbi:hypothetical protein [Niveibacterium sp.]|uniref:hypothetical protein n=1 Tax=Niveibacterium sp. TaxID=2017444 RepID=UPI0035B08058